MGVVARYNIYKSISTILTIGAPLLSLASCSELFVHRSETAISAAGVFAILFALLFFKDKLLENFKAPSPLIISICGLIILHLIENIIYPMKIVFWVTVVSTGIDELTFRRLYKGIERTFGDGLNDYKRFGFLFIRSSALTGGNDEQG